MNRNPIESEMEVFARVYSDKDVNIVMGSCFCTNGKTIEIVPIEDQASEWERFMVEVIVYHEIGHIKNTDFSIIPENKVLHSIHNGAVEDVWIEREMETTWEGMRGKWIEFLTKYVKTDRIKINHECEVVEYLTCLLYFRSRELILGIDLGLTPPAHVLEIYDARLTSFPPRIAKCKSTKEAIEIAKEILDALKDLIKKEDEKEDGEGEEGEGEEGEGEEGEGEEGEGGEGKGEGGEGKGEGGEGKGDEEGEGDEGGEGEEGEGEEGEGKPGKPTKGEKGKELSTKARELLKKLSEQIEKGAAKDGSIMGEVRNRLNKLVTTTGVLRKSASLKDRVIRPSLNKGWETEVARLESEGDRLTNYCGTKLRTLFISERASRWQNGLETGRLDTRRLTSVVTSGSKNVFRRKLESVYEDSAVMLVVDHSGSMGCTAPSAFNEEGKAELSHALVCALSKEMERLRIPFEVIGYRAYSDSGSYDNPGLRTAPVVIENMKLFDESYRHVRQNFSWPTDTDAQQNNELPVIEHAAKRLWARKETRKIMMIFSDGDVCFGTEDLHSLTVKACKKLVDKLMKAGMVVVGFGIQDKHIGNYCSRWIHVDNVKSFAGKFYGELQKIMLGR